MSARMLRPIDDAFEAFGVERTRKDDDEHKRALVMACASVWYYKSLLSGLEKCCSLSAEDLAKPSGDRLYQRMNSRWRLGYSTECIKCKTVIHRCSLKGEHINIYKEFGPAVYGHLDRENIRLPVLRRTGTTFVKCCISGRDMCTDCYNCAPKYSCVRCSTQRYEREMFPIGRVSASELLNRSFRRDAPQMMYICSGCAHLCSGCNGKLFLKGRPYKCMDCEQEKRNESFKRKRNEEEKERKKAKKSK